MVKMIDLWSRLDDLVDPEVSSPDNYTEQVGEKQSTDNVRIHLSDRRPVFYPSIEGDDDRPSHGGTERESIHICGSKPEVGIS